MTTIEIQLLERLKQLPPARVAEVVDFVDFLASREERRAATQRLTAAFSQLDALSLPRMTEEEVEAEIQSSRKERLAERGS